jgi:hypothetical protein
MSKDELETAYKALQAQVQLQAKEEEYFRVQAEREADRVLHELHMEKLRAPQRKAEAERQEKQDRETFAQAAKTLRSFSVNEANFNVTVQTLGPGFSVYQIQEMVAANGATLSPPTQEELNEWDRQAIAEHNARLRSMDIPTLRKLAREAGARGPAAPQLDETQKVRAAERSLQFQPLLPDSRFKNEIIDYELVQQLSPLELKRLFQIYGSDQITARIKEWNSKVQPNLY